MVRGMASGAEGLSQIPDPPLSSCVATGHLLTWVSALSPLKWVSNIYLTALL